jgi:hypothetical protein
VGPLNALPPELLVGWVLWMVGGVALMRWFKRASAHHTTAPGTPRATSSSSVRLPASASGVRLPGTRTSGVRAPKVPDAFGELQALLDTDDADGHR